VRSAASGAMADKGENRLSGNAKANCRTETAALIDLHGSSGALSAILAKPRGGEYRRGAAVYTLRNSGLPDGRGILGSSWQKRCKFSVVSPEAAQPA